MNHYVVSPLRPVHFFLLLKTIHENEKTTFLTKGMLKEGEKVNRWRMRVKCSSSAYMNHTNIIHVYCIFIGGQIQDKQDNKEMYVTNETKHNG